PRTAPQTQKPAHHSNRRGRFHLLLPAAGVVRQRRPSAGRGGLARPASSVALLPHDDCGSATMGALKAATLIAPECQVPCRTASPISTSDLSPLRPPPSGLPCLSYHAGSGCCAGRPGTDAR